MVKAAVAGDNPLMIPASIKRYAWLSIGAALLTIALKTGAWWLTGSVGLLSDALESLVNLAGAVMALAMLTLAAQPEDRNHAFGHGKAEYFSSGFEGLLILLAAIGIGAAAIERLLHPRPLEEIGLGLLVSVLASIINLLTARTLLAAGRQYGSIALEADARHLMTDVWTSAGVLVGLVAVALTGWLWLDPVLALLVAANIVRTGWQMLRRSANGLMDLALPAAQHRQVVDALEAYRSRGIDYHALRTRQAGSRCFVSVHILVPGAWTVQRGHELLEAIEADIRTALPRASVFTHLEPLEDPASQCDISLDR